jgi:hypothetical protein
MLLRTVPKLSAYLVETDRDARVRLDTELRKLSIGKCSVAEIG